MVNNRTPAPPREMLRAIGLLKKRNDLIITKPDKGLEVLIMDKSDYKNLLKESSINDETKFKPATAEIPKITKAFSPST